MDLRNNLFCYATSELSQDAFLCWLASFDLEGCGPDSALQACSHEMLELFVPALTERPFVLTKIERQVKNIDILLTVVSGEQTYKIIVEDKVFTSEHDDQLQHYMNQEHASCPACIVCGVYYKTGFQSDLSGVQAAGYHIVSRSQMLSLMEKYLDQTTNSIFKDYYTWWNEYQKQTLLYREIPADIWETQQILGFYDALQNGSFPAEHHVWVGYGYVSNPKGGFDGLWTGVYDDRFTIFDTSCKLYLQIEPIWDTQRQRRLFPIRIKLSLEQGQSDSTRRVRNKLLYDSTGHYRLTEFHFQKPPRVRIGDHMTIGEYVCPPIKTAEQLKEALASAIQDYRDFLRLVQQSNLQ